MPAGVLGSTVRVKGLRETISAFDKMQGRAGNIIRAELAIVGEPVRSAAAALAVENIRNIGDDWSQMRLGIVTRAVYIAPKQRRRRGSPRPNLAVLLLERAMFPAVEQHEPEVIAALETAIDRLAVEGGF